jgi:hypothetical protein
MNGFFVELLSLMVCKALDKTTIESGYSSIVHDAINDIAQHCDD